MPTVPAPHGGWRAWIIRAAQAVAGGCLSFLGYKAMELLWTWISRR